MTLSTRSARCCSRCEYTRSFHTCSAILDSMELSHTGDEKLLLRSAVIERRQPVLDDLQRHCKKICVQDA